MPSGPSHSHSSGGGGRSGGGSFGGGHSSFGGFGGGMRPRRPMHMHFFGHTVIVSSGRQSAFMALIIFFIMSLFFAFAFGMSSSQNKKDLADNKLYFNLMIEDNSYYKDMIEKADAGVDGYYITEATFGKNIRYEYYENNTPAIYYYDDYGAMETYYIVYSYINEHEVDEETGEYVERINQTYAQYSQNRAYELKNIGKIKIVYHYDVKEQNWVSINYDYPLDITTSYEYKIIANDIQTLESSSKFLGIAVVVAIIIAVALLVGFVLLAVFTVKKSKKDAELEEAKKKAEIREAEVKADVAEEELKKKNRICDYCGCSVPDGASKCPVCGASKFKKKK